MVASERQYLIPPVYASDLVSYLVLQTNFVTAKQFKALKAYNQLMCDWTKDVCSWRKYVTTGRVSFAE